MNDNFKLLYVDDEQDNLTVFSSRFRKTFKIFTANSATEGLSILDQHKIHLVISDQRMPEMTGVQFLQEVREKHPEIVRIILTAYTEAEDIIDAINKGGVYSFIKKPWTGEELKIVIDKGLSFYSLRKRNQDLIQRLYTSLNELEMFYYRISHELRGPIATQFGILALSKQDVDPANAIHYQSMLEESIRKLETTVKSIGATHLPPDKGEPELIDFRSIIDAILLRLKDEIEGKGVSFQFDIEPDIKYHSYPSIVNGFLENMIENGVFFSDPTKTSRNVRVEIKKTGDDVHIEVSDNGLGIDESQLESVFHPFYRGHALSKGSGLGLYIVKKSVDRLDGTIQITSREKEGTTVVIKLPFDVPQDLITIQYAEAMKNAAVPKLPDQP